MCLIFSWSKWLDADSCDKDAAFIRSRQLFQSIILFIPCSLQGGHTNAMQIYLIKIRAVPLSSAVLGIKPCILCQANTLPTNYAFGPLSVLIFKVQSQQFAQASLEFAISLPQPPDLLGSLACSRRPDSCFICASVNCVSYFSKLF